MAFFQGFYPKFLRNWVFYVTVFVFVVLIVLWIGNPFDVADTFFGKVQKTPAEILSYIGIVCGAILLLGNQYTTNRRNLIMEKGNLDIRFKDAALLLANEATSATISGIYALHQVAVEASRGDKNEQGYVKTIHDILCAFVRENWRKTSDDTTVGNKPKIVLQTLMDVLFKNEKDIYKEYYSDLSNCVFQDINLENATLTNVGFNDTKLTNVWFSDAILTFVGFNNAKLTEVWFPNAKLTAVGYSDAKLTDVGFSNAKLTEVWFNNAKSIDVGFRDAKLTNVRFRHAKLANVDFFKATLANVDFFDTILKDYTYEEITSKGFSLEKTKAKDE